MTNQQFMQSLNTEELANFIIEDTRTCAWCIYHFTDKCKKPFPCLEGIIKWLNAEMTER